MVRKIVLSDDESIEKKIIKGRGRPKIIKPAVMPKIEIKLEKKKLIGLPKPRPSLTTPEDTKAVSKEIQEGAENATVKPKIEKKKRVMNESQKAALKAGRERGHVMKREKLHGKLKEKLKVVKEQVSDNLEKSEHMNKPSLHRSSNVQRKIRFV